MDIYKVRDNLKNTIKGKELLLSQLNGCENKFTREFVETNIKELKTILTDVNLCCDKETDRDIADGWEHSPDGMGN